MRFIRTEFPSVISVRQTDEAIMTLLDVAARSAPRVAYLYYYQVLEYAGHYYVDDKTRNRLRMLVRDPAIAECTDDTVSKLFASLTDFNHSDEAKIQKTIEETCDPKNVWSDVVHDREFFSHKVEFEGGYVADPLISTDTTVSAWVTMSMPKLFQVLTKIRNVLVHAREKRENLSILPTNRNNELLRHYVPVIRRVAEEVALRF